MPGLIPSKHFVKDAEKFGASPQLRKKLCKALALLEGNPLHPGVHLERIVNDPTAWAVRIDHRYRLSFDPQVYYPAGNPDWNGDLLLLRLLDHDDLYRAVR